MADEPAAATHATAKGFDFLTKKVGPLPLGVWALAAVVIWYYVGHKGGSSSTGTTDPAGNVGTIDPSTGYVYGSAADQAAQNAQSGGTSSSESGSASTTAGSYTDNNAWGRAAINYLVGLGIDPTTANEAVQQYLSSQTLTTAQQGDVNLAIQGLGAPPNVPGPVGTSTTPVVKTTPATPATNSTVSVQNPPTGFRVLYRNRDNVGIGWNKVTGANAYVVSYGTHGQPAWANSTRVAAPSNTYKVGGLKSGTAYWFRVYAMPSKTLGPTAYTQTTTQK